MKEDDMEILGEGTEIIQRLLRVLEEGTRECGMKVNAGKTKMMQVNSEEDTVIRVGQGRIERVKKYRYLETILTEDWKRQKI